MKNRELFGVIIIVMIFGFVTCIYVGESRTAERYSLLRDNLEEISQRIADFEANDYLMRGSIEEISQRIADLESHEIDVSVFNRTICIIDGAFTIILNRTGSIYYAAWANGTLVHIGTEFARVFDESIDSLASTGGLLQLTAQKFVTNATLHLDQRNIIVQGMGASFNPAKGTVIYSETDNINLIEITADETVLRDLTVAPNCVNWSDGYAAVCIKDTEEVIFDVTIENVNIFRTSYSGRNIAGTGFLLNASDNGILFVLIRNCRTNSYTLDYCVRIFASAAFANGNMISECFFNQIHNGIKIHSKGTGGVNKNSIVDTFLNADHEWGNTISGIWIQNGTGNNLNNVKIWDFNFQPESSKSVIINSTARETQYIDGMLSVGGERVIDDSSSTKWFKVLGYTTENEGTITLADGSTSVNVSHGVDYTPSAGDIQVHPIEALGSASYWWVQKITAKTFEINVNADPGQDIVFAWSVDRH